MSMKIDCSYETMRESDLDEVLGWVLSWGTEVKVLGPRKLKMLVLQAARAVLDRSTC